MYVGQNELPGGGKEVVVTINTKERNAEYKIRVLADGIEPISKSGASQLRRYANKLDEINATPPPPTYD